MRSAKCKVAIRAWDVGILVHYQQTVSEGVYAKCLQGERPHVQSPLHTGPHTAPHSHAKLRCSLTPPKPLHAPADVLVHRQRRMPGPGTYRPPHHVTPCNLNARFLSWVASLTWGALYARPCRGLMGCRSPQDTRV